MDAKTIASGVLSNGMRVELREAQGFSGNCELAIFLSSDGDIANQKFAGAFSIEKKRSGTIAVKPFNIVPFRFPAKNEQNVEDTAQPVKPPKPEPSLTGIKQ